MSLLNSILRAIFDGLLYPARSWPPLLSLAIISLVVGIVMLLVFKVTSNQTKLADVKRRIHSGRPPARANRLCEVAFLRSFFLFVLGAALQSVFLQSPAQEFDPVLSEKGLVAQQIEKRPWEDDGTLAASNPAGTVPVLIDEPPTGGEVSVCPALAIIEYLEEAYPTTPLFPSTSAARAETRRLCAWLDQKFDWHQ